MNHNHIPRILALILVIALVVICIVLAQPVRAAGQRIVDWPELPWEPDPEDVEMLACAIYCEAGGDACSDECRYDVGDVILNRRDDPRFPDTIEGVLTQPGQYGRFSKTGIVWPERANNPGEAHAVQRAYDIAYDLLAGNHGELYGQGYVWQAEFTQGSGFWLDGLYFGK